MAASQLNQKDDIDDLSEISSGMRQEEDPNSLENRLKNIRNDLKFDYGTSEMFD